MSPDDGRCREAPTAVCSVLRSGHKFITQVEVHVQQIAVHILRSGTFACRRALVRVCAATPAAAPAGRVAGDVGRGAGGARAPRPRAAPRAAPRGAPPRGCTRTAPSSCAAPRRRRRRTAPPVLHTRKPKPIKTIKTKSCSQYALLTVTTRLVFLNTFESRVTAR